MFRHIKAEAIDSYPQDYSRCNYALTGFIWFPQQALLGGVIQVLKMATIIIRVISTDSRLVLALM